MYCGKNNHATEKEDKVMDQSESKSKAGDPNTITVNITKDSSTGYVSVDKDPVHINSSQKVEWSYGATDSQFTVVFPGECPFDKAVWRSGTNTQGSGESVTSQKPTSGLPTNIHKTYKYVVAFDTGEAIDPGVVLH